MIKHKSKDAEKRREAKRRRKVSKRKTRVRATNIRNVFAGYPDIMPPDKLSAVILDYAEPMIEELGSENGVAMSILFWNASFVAQKEALETIVPAFDELAGRDQILKEVLCNRFEIMYERKQCYFPNDKRFVTGFSLQDDGERLSLQVMSTVI